MRIFTFIFVLLLACDLFADTIDSDGFKLGMMDGPVGVACTDFSGLWEGDCVFDSGTGPGYPLILLLGIEQKDCSSVTLGSNYLRFGVPWTSTGPWGEGGTVTTHILTGFHEGESTRLIENRSFVRSAMWAGHVSMEIEHGYSVYKIEDGTLVIDGFRVENSFWSGHRGQTREISKSCRLKPVQG